MLFKYIYECLTLFNISISDIMILFREMLILFLISTIFNFINISKFYKSYNFINLFINLLKQII